METRTPTQEAPLLTPRDVGRVIGAKRTKVNDLLVSGILPSFKIGQHRRIRREDLERFLEERRDPKPTVEG